MKKSIHLALALAATAACSVASAGVITFESFAPGVYSQGATFGSGYDILTVQGTPSEFLGGAILQGSDPLSCEIAACPVGNASRYYVGLADTGLNFMRSDMSILLSSLDFGFVLPVASLVVGPVGQLRVTGTLSNGTTTSVEKDFSAQNAGGKFAFSRWDIGGTFAQTRFTQVAFNACLYLDNFCSFDSDDTRGQAQFAIDNIAFVPEPASLALVGVSLFGMFAAGRRSKSRKSV